MEEWRGMVECGGRWRGEEEVVEGRGGGCGGVRGCEGDYFCPCWLGKGCVPHLVRVNIMYKWLCSSIFFMVQMLCKIILMHTVVYSMMYFC